MLTIIVPLSEDFDESTGTFVVSKDFVLELEHSLASLAKWESREEKAFLGKEEKSQVEILRYLKDMTLTEHVPNYIYDKLSADNLAAIDVYINAKMTATSFRKDENQRPHRETITAEIMYYWMVSLAIPFSCDRWHLNRLITLVQVCNEKNKPAKKGKMTSDTAAQRAELNRSRQQQHSTRG